MPDLFDRVLDPGRDLLGRVDRVLRNYGVPAGDPILSLIAEHGALPGEVLEFAAALRPELLLASAADLPRPVSLPRPPVDWSGLAAEAFGVQWRKLDNQQTELATRLDATAAFAESVAGWMTELRSDLAMAIVIALGSAEAVTIRTWSDGADVRELTVAAAALGYQVLAGVHLFDVTGWNGRLTNTDSENRVTESGWQGNPGGFTVSL